MSSTISGLGSGLDISSWISQLVAAKQSSTITPLETKLNTLETQNKAVSSLKSKYSTLQSSLQTFTKSLYNSSSDMWNKSTISSSNEAFATATASGTVSASQVELKIEQIATATTASSANSLGTISKENIQNTKFVNLANSQAKAGTFTMFLDGKEYGIEIKEDDTVQKVIDNISEKTEGKIKANVDDDGNFSIVAVDENSTLSLGASGDTSNIVSALKLHNKIGEYGYSSTYNVSTVNTSVAISNAQSGLSGLKFYDENGQEATSGKVIINGVEIEVDEKTSINDLISKINNESDTKVKASYDALNNKITLTSTTTGQNNISLKSDGTNMLNVLGFTQGEGENEVLAKDTQTLGQNAIVYVNGNKVISNSNTITGESSGIANLSINIKKETSDYSLNPDDDKTITLDIKPDYSQVKKSLEGFVSAYNDAVKTTKNLTKSDGTIGSDSALNSILNRIRNKLIQPSDNEGAFSLLSQIGITSSYDDPTQLEIDDEKLNEALSKNLESVKLLISDGQKETNDTGVFDSVLKEVSAMLNVENGYFSTKTDSLDMQIKTMNSRIERANTRLTKYEEQITKQFNKMDELISTLNSQFSTFSSYFG